jgi:hypothetical protein
MTQLKVAHAVGVSTGRVSQIEHGNLFGLEVLNRSIEVLFLQLGLVATLGTRNSRSADRAALNSSQRPAPRESTGVHCCRNFGRKTQSESRSKDITRLSRAWQFVSVNFVRDAFSTPRSGPGDLSNDPRVAIKVTARPSTVTLTGVTGARRPSR